MTGIRVYEFAKEHKLSSKEMLTVAKNNGIEFSSHMSMMNQEQQAALNNILAKKNEPAAKPKKQENSDKPTEHRHEKAEKPAKQGKKPKHLRNDEDEVEEIAPKKSAKLAKHNKQAKSLVEEHNENGDDRGRRGRRNRRNRDKKNQQPVSKGITARKHKDLPEKLVYTEGMNIQDIAKLIHRDASEIIKKLLMLGVMANQNQALSKEVIELIAMEYGIEPEEKIVVDTSDLEIYFQNESATDEEKSTRPPVVTIMGHVDHGKTTLLDQLRNSRVTEGEAGGITQHIGAYQVDIEGKTITFLDTPGHEAFTTMRARGADVTDITIIVVAADDGVMPQTVEAINHAKAADVPIIVAVNKIDKPAANPDRVMQEMTEHGLIPEAWGGETIFVPISAKFNQNIEELLEMILLVAEVQELKANANRLAIGTVIEARLDKAQGSTATLLVQEGTLNVGDPIVVGNTFGKVRTMVNDQGRRIRHAGPATPVEITGLNDAPQAGDLFVVFADEKSARAAGEERAKRAQVELRESKKKVTLDNLFESLQEGELKSVNVIIKGDVQGSVEALSASLQKIEVEGVRVNTIHQAVGAINESDVSLAAASGAIVIGFNVRPTPQARAQAEQDEIDIRLHRIIYNVIDEIETAMKGMLDPEYVEEITGQVVVRETYTVSKLGTIAGSYVLDGMIQRNSKVRIIRDNIVIYDGELASLKRFKDDAKEVTKGFECGIMIENYNDIKVDDIIEPYRMVEVKRV
ncbi:MULTISPECIES: translation initiation factor IF-2 [unclassified Facklamia]|uniref:translation initiation factor IF-2 n=1 Tax=Aerococcaceae TaxID=186827 RepID=UPI0013B61A1C|nr:MULTISPECIES: translation initiation factor IF-2 [unclassified Facklamia]NEW63604.1 translation initiation factor IF-2 [Facklamia sp. 252]NEW67075.1 translation initiation factor IF-2 [Facklamia sp. 253]QQD66379.1 translation initiation factor IF-2 [Aerococcaceae bacterium zg-252]